MPMRLSLLAACSVLLGGCLNFPEEGAYRCDQPAEGCSADCFCPDTETPPVNDRINFLFGAEYGQDIWVVGLNGKLWRRGDGIWSQQGNYAQQLYGGWGRDPAGVQIVGANGFLAESSGDELPVVVPSVVTSASLTAVWSGPFQEGWAVGQGGVMFHRTVDGWAPYASSPTTVDLNAVYGYYSDNVWAVGDGGAAFQWDGSRWTDRPPPLSADLSGVWVSINGDVWVVGAGGASAHYSYQDREWTLVSGALVDLTAISGANPDDVWAGGAAGSVFHYEHGSWVRARNLSTESEPTYGVWSLLAGDLWIGSGTTIEHRRP